MPNTTDRQVVKPRAPEELERLSLIASKKYLEGRAKTVQEALGVILKDEEALSPDHVRRITEMTNTTVLRGLLSTDRERTMGFPLADSEQLIKEYADSKKVEVPSYSDYDKSPEVILQPPVEKTAPIPIRNEWAETSPQQKAAELYNKCTIAEQWLSGELSKTAFELRVAEDQIKDLLKHDLLQGEVTISNLDKYAEDRPEIKPYLREVANHLSSTGELYLIPQEHNIGATTMDKTANSNSESSEYVLDEEHPINQMLGTIIKAQQTLDALIEGVDTIKTKRVLARKVMLSSKVPSSGE